jgi:short-subunit dehydrogenase
MDSDGTKLLCTVIGAGSGISMAVAKRFSTAGYRVAVVARSAANVLKLADELQGAGTEAHGFAGDASSEGSLRKTFHEIHESLGPTEVLIYNAFALGQANPSELPAEQLAANFQVNVIGALVSAQCVIGDMKAAHRGTILFTGGGLALEPEPSYSSLSVGKAGMRSLAFSLHKELAPFDIHVATVTICGPVQEGTRFNPGQIAEAFFELHRQPRGKWDREFVYQ